MICKSFRRHVNIYLGLGQVYFSHSYLKAGVMVPLPSHLGKMAAFSLVNASTSEEKGQMFSGSCWFGVLAQQWII